MTGPTTDLGDVCAVACADAFRGDDGLMVSPMGPIPRLGARLAKATHSPGIVLTDGVATIVDLDDEPCGWMPFARVFDMVWSGRRHVMMGASQLDRHGNQNISALGDFARPKVQLLGVRGGPGNTVCHPTSYWIPNHGPKVFVEAVDIISGVGTDHGAFEIRRVVTNLCVFDLKGPGGVLRLRSVHPGVTVDDVRAATGCAIDVPDDVGPSRLPTPEERAWLHRLDAGGGIRSAVTR
ncbi:MAG: CoA-transferase [Alphaproteobacteria bacterium]|nr:CoA-transferase [Alphaproteobacteria bacterium]